MAEVTKRSPIAQAWAADPEAILEHFDVSADDGLTARQVEEQRRRHGRNELRQAERKSAWEMFIDQFKSIIMALLAAAIVLSFAFGNVVDAIAIIVVVIVTVAIGFFTEWSGRRSMAELRELGTVETTVRRGGDLREISAEELVPGDVLFIDEGDVITADARLIEANKLQVDESPLTGESVPVSKGVAAIDAETELAERENMVFKGTAVTRGSGAAVVVAIGMDTELGAISSLVQEAEEEQVPLEERLDQLGRKLVWVVIGLAAVIVVAGLISGKDTFQVVETAVALAVAAVPEGLPIVATVALARGMWRMAKRNALVEQLTAVETLGSTNTIFTDKTGTLTEEQMTVTRIWLADCALRVGGEGLALSGEFEEEEGETAVAPGDLAPLHQALEAGVLCNNASLNVDDLDAADVAEDAVGEPLEVALLVAGAKAGLLRDDLLAEQPEAREVAFDPAINMMATFHEKENGRYRVAVKGSPEAVIEAATHLYTEDGPAEFGEEQRETWRAKNDEMAEDGLRVVALATKEAVDTEADPYTDLQVIALFGLLDPPREEVKDSIRAVHDAGIHTVMVTGDHPGTARTVGRAVGLLGDDGEGETAVVRGGELKPPGELSSAERERILGARIFARVTPEQKLNLIDLHQSENAIVAMTGDGVNDAPALQKADIGVAMGQRGTDVAKEAADVVLQDDAFGSIAVAVEYGRVIFANIRKFTNYLISGNIGEIVAVAIAALANLPLPLLPLQILYLNVLNDVFPSLALGMSGDLPGVMEEPPRDPDEAIMTRAHWTASASYGVIIGLVVLAALLIALNVFGMNQTQAVTISFLTVAFSRLWHVFNMRGQKGGFISNEVTRNPFVWGALVLCVFLLLLAVYWTPFADLLKLADPGRNGWLLIGGMSLIPLGIGQTLKALKVGEM